MLRDITIGQYYNTKSSLHSLDPRCKLIGLVVMMALIFVAQSVIEYAFVTLLTIALAILSRVPMAYILKGMKPVWLIVAFTAVINIFMGGGETVVFTWWAFTVTKEALYLALSMMLRVVLLVTVSTLLTLTTSPTVLTSGLEKLLKPLEKVKFPSHEVAMMMSIALRFIPTLGEEAEKIMKAQAARGNDIESGGFMKKISGMIPLFVPLFISAFRRADELAMAMECRCYAGGCNRTAFRKLEYKKSDAVAFVLMGTAVLLVVIYRTVGFLI
ncbi:MAG: energy-coupling factor transporter transmembrane protein EcfT [Clostridia bacterium]|nr:energy-coupling factor transporter transmembrane protein EcfT [Clostridia bacterium]